MITGYLPEIHSGFTAPSGRRPEQSPTPRQLVFVGRLLYAKQKETTFILMASCK